MGLLWVILVLMDQWEITAFEIFVVSSLSSLT